MDALDPKKLMEKFAPKMHAYFEDPSKLVGNLNPLVLIAFGVILLGAVVFLAALFTTKYKHKVPAVVLKLVDKMKTLLLFNMIILSLQTSYLDLWISTYKLLQNNVYDYLFYAQR